MVILHGSHLGHLVTSSQTTTGTAPKSTQFDIADLNFKLHSTATIPTVDLETMRYLLHCQRPESTVHIRERATPRRSRRKRPSVQTVNAVAQTHCPSISQLVRPRYRVRRIHLHTPSYPQPCMGICMQGPPYPFSSQHSNPSPTQPSHTPSPNPR